MPLTPDSDEMPETQAKKPLRATLWTTPVVFSFIVLAISGVMLIWWLAHTSPADKRAYLEAIEKSQKLKSREEIASHQIRKGVQKDLHFWKEGRRHHLRFWTPTSQIVLDRDSSGINFKEIAQEIECMLQQELYFREGRPRQKVQLLKAEKGDIDFGKKEARMEGVSSWLVDAPGHTLPVTKEMGEVLMKGRAEVVEIDFFEKFEVRAKQAQGRVFPFNFQKNLFPFYGQGEIEQFVYEFKSGDAKAFGYVDFRFIDERHAQRYRLCGKGSCHLDREKEELVVDSQRGEKVDQISLFTDWGTLRGNRLTVFFKEKKQGMEFTSLVIEDHVSIRNRFSELSQVEGLLDQYILADSLRFSPESKWWILSARPSRRVLFYDVVHGMEVSAPKIGLCLGKSGHPEIRGFGDVRMTLKQKEIKKLQNQFSSFPSHGK